MSPGEFGLGLGESPSSSDARTWPQMWTQGTYAGKVVAIKEVAAGALAPNDFDEVGLPHSTAMHAGCLI